MDNLENNFDLNYSPNESLAFHMDELEIDLNVLPPSQREEQFIHCPVSCNANGHEDIIEESNESIGNSAEYRSTSQSEVGQTNTSRLISSDKRKMIYDSLLQRSENGKLKRSTTTEVAELFSVPIRSVQRIWKLAKSFPIGTAVDLTDRRRKRSGRKRKEVDFNRIAALPLNERTTLRSLANSLDVSHVTLHSRFKEGKLRRHLNTIKPYLKEEHKMARLRFCISMLDPHSLPHDPQFIGMYNIVHIDEKWFCMTEKKKSYYLVSNEEDPLRTCQSKNFIKKVMFLAAVARPRFDECGNEVFSGKVGVFPLVTKQPAQRRSRNREAGTMETKPILSVTKDIVRAFLIDQVIPAIQAKWPEEDRGRTIFIQQDNARTHVQPDDAEFQRAAAQDGFDIRLFYQPANSPDMNVLDLGFFRAIQSLHQKQRTQTVDELIDAVHKAFEEYPTKAINHVFLFLQSCMEETMKVQGSNRYRIPHIGKKKLERNGNLPIVLKCDPVLVEDTLKILG